MPKHELETKAAPKSIFAWDEISCEITPADGFVYTDATEGTWIEKTNDGPVRIFLSDRGHVALQVEAADEAEAHKLFMAIHNETYMTSAPIPTVKDVAEAAAASGMPVEEVWEGVDSPKHFWWALGGPESGNAAFLIAVAEGYREAAPDLY